MCPGSPTRKAAVKMTFEQINSIFEENDCFTILTHKSPDGDTLGCGFALCEFLRNMGKKANVLNSEGFPERYDFIYEGYYEQDFEEQYVIAVDIADTVLLGHNLERYAKEGAIDLCIDHHISNKNYAKNTYVDAKAPAAALILYKIMRESGKPVTKHIAEALYTGIATDTGCFKYENTTPETHRIAAELMENFDINFAVINRKMFDVKSKARMRVEQGVARHMEYYYDDKCSLIILSRETMEESGVDASEFEGLASIPLSVEGVQIGITVKERHENVYKISVRTTEEVDASAFCKNFGGGGHIRAAGCEIHAPLAEVRSMLLMQVDKELNGTKQD